MAGPSSDMHDPGPESDTHLELLSIPEETDVSNSSLISFHPFYVSKYQDPLLVLLKYIAEVSLLMWYTFGYRLACAPRADSVQQQAQDCDMALVHDNDLKFLIDEVRLFFRALALSLTH